jgi:hypothetical protein
MHARDWCTGNGDLLTPAYYAIVIGSKWKLNIALAVQALLFKFPWRWSDEKKKLERSKGSSCDWLNFFHAAKCASPWVLKLVSKETLYNKIKAYYLEGSDFEPNAEWLVELYRKAIYL